MDGSSPAPVFHHASKPVSINEFRDAVYATCRPVFPTVRFARHRKLILAVSGGLDSMALAFLTAGIVKHYRRFHVADNPIAGLYTITVDHQLRQGSDVEAKAVSAELLRLGLRTFIKPLDWKRERAIGLEPAQLRNIETLARVKRYQAIGRYAVQMQATSVFLAHHQDDQYETVMMRLLAGHGYRGLQGIREANAIPECYELHRIYKSGLVDDQLTKFPFLSFRPTHRMLRTLRRSLRYDTRADPWTQIKSYLQLMEEEDAPGYRSLEHNAHAPYLAPLECEDGGVNIYRPLLEFDKDRLRATCEANNVRWFEDATNHDPTLTTRNAVRHLVRSHELPRALQKPAILAMADRSKRRVRLEEAEAHRLLIQAAVIKDFDPNAGTLLIELPTLTRKRGTRNKVRDNARQQARLPQRRLIASIAVRNLIDFVTPDIHSPPLANLQNVVDWLFPELSLESAAQLPRAFGIAGVIFEPVQGPKSIQWYLSRAPYTSSQPVPRRVSYSHRSWTPPSLETEPQEPVMLKGPPRTVVFRQWDGRFWISLTTRVTGHFRIQPLSVEHLRTLRRALPPAQLRRLEAVLKYYAPGKVRYSLPALYTEDSNRHDPDVPGPLTILALPSLGIHVPGLERWVKYDARYKKIDATLLGHTKRGTRQPWLRYRPFWSASRRRRWERLYRWSTDGLRKGKLRRRAIGRDTLHASRH